LNDTKAKQENQIDIRNTFEIMENSENITNNGEIFIRNACQSVCDCVRISTEQEFRASQNFAE